MIPVLGPAAIREADAWTIAQEPITSWALMERAAAQCTARIQQLTALGRFGDPSLVRFVVLAGMGNNGGDGLAIARMLKQAGSAVRVVRAHHRATPSEDNAINLQKAMDAGVAVEERTEDDPDLELDPNEAVIDALFGTGLARPVDGWVARMIERLNRAERPVIAIDLPSGANAEGDLDGGAIVQAGITLSFEVPKLAFFLADQARYVGEWELLRIGLHPGFLASAPTQYYLVHPSDIEALLKPRPRFAHKGSFGHALIVAGSKGRMGACALATRAALRSGAGLVTARMPACGLQILQITAPEALCSVDASEDEITSLPDLKPFNAVGVGPGMGISPHAELVIKHLLQLALSSLVIDADGLNVLAANPTWLAFLPAATILTPHPKEFDRLTGTTAGSSKERLLAAREFAMRNRCHLVLKGAYSAICSPSGKVYFNPTGNSGLAKGGSGDALTGVVTALLAQGYAPLEACLLGVYAHGLAGDLAAETRGTDGVIASDLIEALPLAWSRLRKD